VSVWIDTRGMWSADGRFYDTKIDHAEQHVHLRGALLWRRAFWGYSGTILLNCL
jgi:hypothetical protein